MTRGDAPEARGAEPIGDDQAGTDDQCGHSRVVLGIAMKIWEHHQVAVLRSYAGVLRHGLTSVDVVGVSNQTTFWPAGRARGVQNRHLVLRSRGGDRCLS